jgi:hypothetical protein
VELYFGAFCEFVVIGKLSNRKLVGAIRKLKEFSNLRSKEAKVKEF